MSERELLKLLERDGTGLATIEGNATECPLLGATAWSLDDEIAVAMLERRGATVH